MPWLMVWLMMMSLTGGGLIAKKHGPVRDPVFPAGMHLLYVADTYNHKVKKVDPRSGTTVTFLGTSKAGLQDGPAAMLYEPGGLSVASGALSIAATNNHAIRVADLPTGVVTTLALQGLAIPTAVAGFSSAHFGDMEPIAVQAQTVQAEAAGHLEIALQFPEGYHLNPRAPLTYIANVIGSGVAIEAAHRKGSPIAPALPLRIPFQAAAAGQQATVDLDMTFYYCREDDTGVCVIQSIRWLIPLHTGVHEATRTPVVLYRAEAPQLQKSF